MRNERMEAKYVETAPRVIKLGMTRGNISRKKAQNSQKREERLPSEVNVVGKH